MAHININHLNFTYAGMHEPALQDVSLSVEEGEFLLLCGRSGCGKTTLLRLLKRQLRPHGTLSGEMLFDGEDEQNMDERRAAVEIGYVMQDPDAQIVTDKVWHELAFGLESLGESSSVIRRRVAETVGFFGIGDWYHQSTAELSGGQKQLLNLASIMAMRPRVLLLDEPTAHLDPIAAAEFLTALKKINEELGVTVIIAEHSLEDVFPMVDRVVLMKQGGIRTVAAPRALCEHIDADEAEGLGLPSAVRLHRALGATGDCPLTVREGARYIKEHFACHTVRLPEEEHVLSETVLKAKDIWFRYEKSTPDVLRGLRLDLHRGELLCVLGANGAGKTTLLRVLSGALKPYRGKLERGKERISVLPQRPQMLFLHDTVGKDWREATTLPEKEAVQRMTYWADMLGIAQLADRHPYDLSGGEMQKAALVKLLLCDPDILLLDEPTKGLDAASRADLSDILVQLRAVGKTVVMVTHDVEFCAEHADRCTMFFDGQIIATEPRIAFFSQNHYYTTAASRMSRPYYENAVTVGMLAELCRQNGKKEGEMHA